MPYIIETSEPQSFPGAVAAIQQVVTSRRAVATLFEARDEAAYRVEQITGADEAYGEVYSDAQGCSELGDTFGPLQDGSVVTVRPTDWLELAGLVGWTLDYETRQRLTGRTRASDRRELVDAFNAAQVTTCPNCDGRGYRETPESGARCTECMGTGTVAS